MKKIDYFLTSFILTLTLVGFCSALLIVEFNSSRYIPAQVPRLIEFSQNEVTFLGKTHYFDFSEYDDEIKTIKKASVILPRQTRILCESVKIIYEEIKSQFKAYSKGG